MNWHLFASIYILIFVAELPDKTAFATLLLATKSRPAPVFIGVAAAFLIQTVVAILAGSFISLAPAHWVHLAAGFMFFVFAFQMYSSRFEAEEEAEPAVEGRLPSRDGFLLAAWSSFLVIFIAEWGDLTQIATASLAAKYSGDTPAVFLGALLALWSVTLVAVILGRNARKYINPVAIKTCGAYLFAMVGVYFVVTAVRAFM